jgi:signal peptidase II
MKRDRSLAYATASLVVLSDQLSKAWAVAQLSPFGTTPLWPGLLELHLTRNTGAAFSLFKGHPELLGLVSLLVAVVLIVWIQRQGALVPLRWLGVGLVLGGAIGNGLDRWRLGYVIDFLALVPISFPVFNLADVAINLAVLFFAIDLLGSHGQPRA